MCFEILYFSPESVTHWDCPKDIHFLPLFHSVSMSSCPAHVYFAIPRSHSSIRTLSVVKGSCMLWVVKAPHLGLTGCRFEPTHPLPNPKPAPAYPPMVKPYSPNLAFWHPSIHQTSRIGFTTYPPMVNPCSPNLAFWHPSIHQTSRIGFTTLSLCICPPMLSVPSERYGYW